MRSEEATANPYIRSGLETLCQYIVSKLGRGITLWEVGSFAGESAEIFSKYVHEVVCIDPWVGRVDGARMEDIEGDFDERARRAGNIRKMKMTSLEASKLVADEGIDCVYLDAGDHTYEQTLEDIRLWTPKVRQGGLITGHDYPTPGVPTRAIYMGVKQAISEYFPERELKVFLDTSWAIDKSG